MSCDFVIICWIFGVLCCFVSGFCYFSWIVTIVLVRSNLLVDPLDPLKAYYKAYLGGSRVVFTHGRPALLTTQSCNKVSPLRLGWLKLKYLLRLGEIWTSFLARRFLADVLCLLCVCAAQYLAKSPKGLFCRVRCFSVWFPFLQYSFHIKTSPNSDHCPLS